MNSTSLRRGPWAAVVALTGAISACGSPPEVADPTALSPVSVAVTDAWTGGAPQTFSARIEAAREIGVATRTSGVLRSILADVGDRVRAGQVLAVVDGEDVSARIRGAESRLDLAARTHGRIERLTAQGAASQQELDQAAAALEGARAALAEAEAQSEYVQVTAPFAGLVIERFADAGDLAVPGRPILRIEGAGEAKVVADLPSAAASLVDVGTSTTVRGDGATITGQVTRVVPSLDPASHRFRVEARLESPSPWPSGTLVRLEVAGGRDGSGSRWVPEDAIVRRGQLTGVLSLESDTLRLRWLQLGRRTGTAAEILAGPEGSLTVVRRPSDQMVDGQPVSAVTREPAR